MMWGWCSTSVSSPTDKLWLPEVQVWGIAMFVRSGWTSMHWSTLVQHFFLWERRIFFWFRAWVWIRARVWIGNRVGDKLGEMEWSRKHYDRGLTCSYSCLYNFHSLELKLTKSVKSVKVNWSVWVILLLTKIHTGAVIRRLNQLHSFFFLKTKTLVIVSPYTVCPFEQNAFLWKPLQLSFWNYSKLFNKESSSYSGRFI